MRLVRELAWSRVVRCEELADKALAGVAPTRGEALAVLRSEDRELAGGVAAATRAFRADGDAEHDREREEGDLPGGLRLLLAVRRLERTGCDVLDARPGDAGGRRSPGLGEASGHLLHLASCRGPKGMHYSANAILVGGCLTTPGQSAQQGWQMPEDLGFEIERCAL
jgi:hypothetical protein